MTIPVIDLFAGPGGLGEGFSSVTDDNGNRVFEIKLSIEKDPFAHQTLELRSFLRQFPIDHFPPEYYTMVRENDPKKRDVLKKEMFKKYINEYNTAKDEAWQFELPYKVEKNPDTNEKSGYSLKQIKEKHKEIDEKIASKLKGESNWLLIGGPPCQAYSLVGRARNQGISNEDHRVHLYKEYLRIIAKHHPAVFVMENVKGLLSARVEDEMVFEWIKKDLKNPGTVFKKSRSPKYKIYSFTKNPDKYDNGFPVYHDNSDFLIKTEKYGIPQKRHRVILLGIRQDVEYTGETLLDYLNKDHKEISLKSIISDLPKIRSIASRSIDYSSPTRSYKKIDDSNEVWHNYLKQFREELENNENLISLKLPKNNNTILKSSGNHFIKKSSTLKIDHPLYKWLIDPRLNGVISHESRSHLLEDLKRYYFYCVYSMIYKSFPRLRNVAEIVPEMLPEHQNALSGKFEDRFRVQLPDEPATTVTSHISKDGHYFIHFDHNQCRTLTVREAARIQTFPDNYFFCGTRTQQYHQVGNAVPPFLAHTIGNIVKNILHKNKM